MTKKTDTPETQPQAPEATGDSTPAAPPEPTGPKTVIVQCFDPEDPNPVLHLEPEPTVFVNGKAEMKEVLAEILVGDRNNVYKDGDFGKRLPKFKIVKA